jgi:polyisoprenoid-binding protein YceI
VCARLARVHQEHEHGHDHEYHHEGHDHDHDDGHDHALIVDRMPAGAWEVVTGGSELLFKARAFGVIPVTGVFEAFEGALTAEPGGAVSGQLVVQMRSVNTGWARRDATLRSPSYFDVDRHPEMTFMLGRLAASGSDHMDLSGSLQIRDRSVPLNFPVYLITHGEHLHLEGEVTVDYDIAGLGWSKPFFVAERLRLETALTLIRA